MQRYRFHVHIDSTPIVAVTLSAAHVDTAKSMALKFAVERYPEVDSSRISVNSVAA